MEHQTEPCGTFERLVGRSFLRAIGWELVGEVPPYPRFVALGAPHTSNWDLPIVVASAWALGVRMRFLVKSEIFTPTTGWFFRALGAVSVDRSAPQGLVQQMVDTFAASERMALMIPPEGTRAKKEAWKSGFYRIALAADVPVVASFADYARRQSGIAGSVRLTGDVDRDMAAIRSLYRGITPRFPELMTPVRLKAETNASEGSASNDAVPNRS